MQLTAHDGATEGWATLGVRSFPFIIGNSVDGVSWECPCGKALGTGLHSRQVLNVLIRCGGCSRLLTSPLRAPGDPIAGRPVYIPPGGTHLLGGRLDVLDKPVMMVGHDALVGYARETGRRIPDVYDPDLAPALSSLDPGSLTRLADELTALLGDEHKRLQDSDARGRRSRTPPRDRHRLIELIEFAQRTAAAFEGWNGRDHLDVDGDLLAESVTALAAARRWQNHPAWPALRASLVSETEHTIMLLTVASYLVDANNGVGVHVNTSRQNATTADMWIEPDLRQRVDLEVKTPVALRSPKLPIPVPHALAILERALKKSSRQRGNTRTSLLVIGGYHMGQSCDTVVSTARGMLALERRRWRGLAGVVVADCTYQAEQLDAGRGTQFSPVARFEIALHPGYRGDLSIETDAQPTSALPQQARPS